MNKKQKISHFTPDNSLWITETDVSISFSLDPYFIRKYEDIVPDFGFNGLGEFVYKRTYSRIKVDGSHEVWYETVKRVVEGTYSIMKAYVLRISKGRWSDEKAQRSAQEMYDRIFRMKFLPPGRGLWAMGTNIITTRGLGASLNNCAFCSTENMDVDPVQAFVFLMDATMLGVGVGFDTLGAGKVIIKQPTNHKNHIISDSREGWVESVKLLISSYLTNDNGVIFDYSQIRPAGELLKTFGGLSSGHGPLKNLHDSIDKIFTKLIGKPITVTCIVDIMNLIGKCVVSGNVRRSAEIAFGDPDDVEFINLKNYELNPERMEWGWLSNNSVFSTIGMDYSKHVERIISNGEPGFAWLDNMRAYSRMCEYPDNIDFKVKGGNPCLEQSLEHMELCCLVETFPCKADNMEDFKRTLKFAHLYAKIVTLVPTQWKETREVMSRNRRIGCSISGITQFITSHNIETLRQWCVSGYDALKYHDRELSRWLNIPESIKLTSIKPSGSVSLLVGASPGIHHMESRYYIRRVRLARNHPLVNDMKNKGYKIEACVGSEDTTVVIEIPVDVGEGTRELKNVSMWEQLGLAAFMQRYWADNQVSATITFDPKTEGKDIVNALNIYQYQLKGISFLPLLTDCTAYPQMPYESITEIQYKENILRLKLYKNTMSESNTTGWLGFQLEQQEQSTHRMEDAFCNNDTCMRT